MEEIRETIRMEGEDRILKIKEFRGLQISYRVSDNLLYLTELSKFLSQKYHVSIDLYNYMESNEFHISMIREDSSLYPKSHVYLLDMKNGTFKVGKAFDINQRYSGKSITEYLVKLYTVDNETITEQELLKAMREKFKQVEGTQEFFEYNTLTPVINLFTSIAIKHKLYVKDLNSQLIDTSMTHVHYFPGIYGHPDVARILIHKFCSVHDDLQNWMKLLESHKFDIGGTTVNIMKDETTGQDNIFCYFKGYMFIRQLHSKYYNASRMINSIVKTDKMARKNLNRYINHDKRFIKMQQDFQRTFRESGIINNIGTRESKLKEIYLHEYLMDMALKWVSPKYNLVSTIFMHETIKIPTNESSVLEKLSAINDLLKLLIITSGEKIKFYGKKEEFDISKLISHSTFDTELPYIMSEGKINTELIMQNIEFIS